MQSRTCSLAVLVDDKGRLRPEPAQELLSSGYLTEVHKFSKFIHGTATLMPDMVQVRTTLDWQRLGCFACLSNAANVM